MWLQKCIKQLNEAVKEGKTLLVIYKKDQVGKGNNMEWGSLRKQNNCLQGYDSSQREKVVYLLKYMNLIRKKICKAFKGLNPTKAKSFETI